MVLVTGATGFIGKAVVQKLILDNRKVRILVNPSISSEKFIKGIQIDTAITSITDERGVRAALKGITDVIHCASAEWESPHADLEKIDVQGTKILVNAIRKSEINRLIYYSHLGADRASIFPLLKAKAIAEEIIKNSHIPYTIIRCAAVYGYEDHFITWLVKALRNNPLFFTLPGDGKEIIQPLWIDDLTALTALLLGDAKYMNKELPAGGGEYFSFREVVEKVMQICRLKRILIPIAPAYLRGLRLWFGEKTRLFPLNAYWLDYLAADRTCALDALPRYFGIIPSRFDNRLSVLTENGFSNNK